MGYQVLRTFKIFLSSLPDDFTNEHLNNMFEPYGRVVEAEVFKTNFGFVHMEDEASGKNAIKALNGHMIDGKKLSVCPSKNNEPPKIATTKLQLGNLSNSVDLKLLRELFTKYGIVLQIENHGTGKGVVHLDTCSDIRTAIKEMNGYIIDNQTLTVEPMLNSPSSSTPNSAPPNKKKRHNPPKQSFGNGGGFRGGMGGNGGGFNSGGGGYNSGYNDDYSDDFDYQPPSGNYPLPRFPPRIMGVPPPPNFRGDFDDDQDDYFDNFDGYESGYRQDISGPSRSPRGQIPPLFSSSRGRGGPMGGGGMSRAGGGGFGGPGRGGRGRGGGVPLVQSSELEPLFFRRQDMNQDMMPPQRQQQMMPPQRQQQQMRPPNYFLQEDFQDDYDMGMDDPYPDNDNYDSYDNYDSFGAAGPAGPIYGPPGGDERISRGREVLEGQYGNAPQKRKIGKGEPFPPPNAQSSWGNRGQKRGFGGGGGSQSGGSRGGGMRGNPQPLMGGMSGMMMNRSGYSRGGGGGGRGQGRGGSRGSPAGGGQVRRGGGGSTGGNRGSGGRGGGGGNQQSLQKPAQGQQQKLPTPQIDFTADVLLF